MSVLPATERLFASSLREAEREGRQWLKDAIAEYQPEAVIALFSGGNDSTVMTHLGLGMLTHAAHINTGIGIPETTEFVKQTASTWGLPLIELVTPPDTYERLLFHPFSLRKKPHKAEEEYEGGFPGANAHDTTYYYLKQARLAELRRMFVKKRGQRVIFVTGIRASESTRRMRTSMAVPVERDGSVVWVNPILRFDHDLMSRYRDAYPVPRNPVADLLHRSGECLCGAMAKSEELDEIALWYPEVAARIRGYEAQAEALGLKNCKWGGQGRGRPKAGGKLCQDCTLRLFEDEPKRIK